MSKMAKTPAQRKADERQRRRASGQHLVQEWVFAEDVIVLRRCAARLRAKHGFRVRND